MIWKSIQKDDRAFFEHYFSLKSYPVSDYNFTHLNIWKDSFDFKYTLVEDFLVISGKDPITKEAYIFMPIGTGNLDQVIKTLLFEFKANQKQLIIKAITPKMKIEFQEKIQRHFTYRANRNDFEYIYETDKIANYTSKKLKRKKEQCHSFEQHYEYVFSEYQDSDRQGVMALLSEWYSHYESDNDPIIQGEKVGIQYVLDHYDQFSCRGFLIKVADKVIGFTLAEQLTEQIMLIHFEKGDRNYKGIYDIMKRDLSKWFKSVEYISLEEDMGIRGLRTAKKMYEPAAMIEKGIIQFDVNSEVDHHE